MINAMGSQADSAVTDPTLDGTLVALLKGVLAQFAAEAAALGKGVLLQGDDGTDRQNVQLTSAGDLRAHDNWTPTLQADETANDSDKTMAVSAGKEWYILWIWLELATSASAGNRQMELQVTDPADDVLLQIQASVTQAAGSSACYLFAPGMMDLLALRDGQYLTTPIPPGLILPAGYKVRLWDNNAVDAAADDLTVQMMVLQRTP